jgi:hypothetical protein
MEESSVSVSWWSRFTTLLLRMGGAPTLWRERGRDREREKRKNEGERREF